ncbi:hypothetical protein JOQ06_028957 [Pogonophryne albipinna]|uniref:Transposase Tc1-like domain-containing protein n=1 Tax=Pogonophryne albipinna TaxID=1090488 RepID=A0AAD6FND1_9TELE|nr:hypothetical protein JOQ06_028957 [Pogonophryne albipinna]
MITRTVSNNPRTTRGDLVNDLQRAGTKVTKATISNTLRRQGLKSCSARRVPLLKPVHVQAHLKFATEHLDDPEEDWENVICLDEQVGRCLQACELEASAAPPSTLCARETFADVWQSPSSFHLHSSPNTVVHEYGWQARLPGIINVPQAHINHITIKPPNALMEKCLCNSACIGWWNNIKYSKVKDGPTPEAGNTCLLQAVQLRCHGTVCNDIERCDTNTHQGLLSADERKTEQIRLPRIAEPDSFLSLPLLYGNVPV